MDLIKDDESHQLGVRPLPTFPCDDVPLFRSADNHLGLVYLLLGQLTVSSQLVHHQSILSKPLTKIARHLGTERLHWCNVDDLELVNIDGAIVIDVLANLMQHGEQGHVGLSSASGCAQQKVFLTLHTGSVQFTLDPVERFETFKCRLSVPWKRLDGHEFLIFSKRLWFESRHMNLLVTFLLLSKTSIGQLAPFVCHEMAALRECEVL